MIRQLIRLGGAQSYGYGRPRNHVIGMRVALADGRIVKAGGRVVKNVAGYDLCKLFVGSYGTLCLILELTFKLRPRPRREATVIIRSEDRGTLFSCARRMFASSLMPVALEILSPSVSAALGINGDDSASTLLIRFSGSDESVSDQIEHARMLSKDEGIAHSYDVVMADSGLWHGLAAIALGVEDALVWRARVHPTDVAAYFDEVETEVGAFSSTFLWHAGAGDGRLRFITYPTTSNRTLIAPLERLRASARALGGALVMENVPAELTTDFGTWGEVVGSSAKLMKRVKRQLDPQGLFHSSSFVPGI